MPPDICNFPSNEFYGGTLQSAVHNADSLFSKFNDSVFIPYHSKEQNDEVYSNNFEAQCCVKLSTLLKDFSITILAFYNLQVEILNSLLETNDKLNISTIDAFQCREDDVIIISCSRANLVTGFMDNWNRVNVALTRAKKKCIVIGHRDTLETSSLWNSYIQHHQSMQAIYSFDDFCNILAKNYDV